MTPMRLRHRLLRNLLALATLTALAACRTREEKDALAAWRQLRHHSLLVTQKFLAAADRADSSALAAVGSDSVVARVLLYRRVGAGRHFQAAATSFHETKMTLYGWGADVQFTYVYGGRTETGFALLEFDRGALRVTRFGVPGRVD